MTEAKWFGGRGDAAHSSLADDDRWAPEWAGWLVRAERKSGIPLLNRRFWMVQALIAVVTAAHITFEYLEPSVLGEAYFVPASLYLFPVLYASLNFGLEGALPTALLSAALSAPDIAMNHQGTARFGETFQVSTILVLSVLVAIRVDKERDARRASERLQQEATISERKYRSLFENAGEAILVVQRRVGILEANAAAERIGVELSKREPTLQSQLGSGGRAIEAFISGESAEIPDFSLIKPDGSEVWLQPVVTVSDARMTEVVQVLLRDVTERHGFQNYAQEVVQAQEDERERIAHELHDVSVQSSVLICRQLDEIAAAFRARNTKAGAAKLAEARDTAEQMADELRRFSRDLRPLILEDLGFVPALKRLVSEMQERSQIHVRFEVRGEPRRLDRRAELVLFRIGQEALRNAEHHAAAERVSILLTFDTDVCRLRVADNGVGFVVPALTALVNAGNLGLLGMQQRARVVGGTCRVLSRPDEGTLISAEVPAAIPATCPGRA